jgi:hypothetical protein
MYKPRNLKWGLIRLGLAALFFYWAWDHWREIAALEAGEDVKVKMWRPLAMIYNHGGVWSVIAKWTSHVGTLLICFGTLIWGISDLRPLPQPEPPPVRRLP